MSFATCFPISPSSSRAHACRAALSITAGRAGNPGPQDRCPPRVTNGRPQHSSPFSTVPICRAGRTTTTRVTKDAGTSHVTSGVRKALLRLFGNEHPPFNIAL